MDWTEAIVVGLFAVACGSAVYGAWRNEWAVHRTLGMAVFLLGVAISLFLDDLLPPASPVLPWTELIGVVVVLAGIFIRWFWRPQPTPSDESH